MAIYAVNESNPKFLFVINYKVMYSTLRAVLPKYFPEVQFFYKNKIKSLDFKRYKKIAIIRNPYSRAVSAFYDKCKVDPVKTLKQGESKLQTCQAQLLKELQTIRDVQFDIMTFNKTCSVSENPEERTVLNKNYETLLSMSFEEYVGCVHLIFKNKNPDGHFERQIKAFDVLKKNPLYFWQDGTRGVNIIKLENIDQDWGMVCKTLGVEMALKKANSTKDKRAVAKEIYSEKTQKKIFDLYKIDFQKLDYPSNL